MASKDVHDTASLVRSYNEATDEEEKSVLMEWFSRYISRFDNLTGVLDRCHWEAFLELGNIDSRGNTGKEVSRFYPILVLTSGAERLLAVLAEVNVQKSRAIDPDGNPVGGTCASTDTPRSVRQKPEPPHRHDESTS